MRPKASVCRVRVAQGDAQPGAGGIGSAALFVNVANRLQPTEAAHRLYKASRTFVEGFRELEDAVAAMKLSQKTEVRLGGTYDSDDVFTTAEWRAFRSYPTEEHDINVKLRYVRGSRPTLLAALLDGSLDYAHVVFTGGRDAVRMSHRHRGRIFLTCGGDHRWQLAPQ